MSLAVFVIALLGCGEGEAPCRQLSVLEARYSDRASCAAAAEAALARSPAEDYPIIVAQCREEGADIIVHPREVQLPAPQAPAAPAR
jgi:hypothetical protein